MAKVTFGSGVAGLRGKLGGSVFSAATNGPYVKQFRPPVHRRSLYQEAFRARIAQTRANWGYMSDVQRAAWDSYAAAPNELDYDPWGTQVFLTGFQWYIRSQVRLYWPTNAWQPNPPHGAAQTPISDLALDLRPLDVGASYVDFSAPVFGATEIFILETALAPDAARLTPSSKWRITVAQQNPGAPPYSIGIALSFVWGSLRPGWRVCARAWNQSDHGNRSTVATASTIVSDT